MCCYLYRLVLTTKTTRFVQFKVSVRTFDSELLKCPERKLKKKEHHHTCRMFCQDTCVYLLTCCFVRSFPQFTQFSVFGQRKPLLEFGMSSNILRILLLTVVLSYRSLKPFSRTTGTLIRRPKGLICNFCAWNFSKARCQKFSHSL